MYLGGGGALAILCVLGMCCPQGYVFHNFCLGRVLFSAQQSGKGTFFTVSVWEGVVFRPNSLARGVLWSWFDAKILARVVILPLFSGKGGKFLPGKGKGMPPGLHTPIHNLVKSPPPPPGPCTTQQMRIKRLEHNFMVCVFLKHQDPSQKLLLDRQHCSLIF